MVLLAIGFSCSDADLDPLQSEKVKKGTLLALRGDQLDAIYWNGEPYGDAFYANAVTGSETFDFDAEFLAENTSTLASVDIYVIERPSKKRVLLTTIPASEFELVEGKSLVSISLPLTDILSKLGVTLNTPGEISAFMTAYADGIAIESDVNLTDGTIVPAANMVAAGLFESDQFYPAQLLTYGVEDIDDARPVATFTQRGQYNATTKKHTILPLKNGAKDTLNIVFDQEIDTPPTVEISPATAGTLGALVPVAGKSNEFYIVFTAGDTYTGDVTFSVTDATSGEEGALNGLVMDDQSTTMAVDNRAPANTLFTTGTRIGKGQSATITLKFNEALGTAPTVTIDPGSTGIDGVTGVKTTLSADGMTATYTYEYKDLDGNATHGDVMVSVSGGADKAGNAVPPITSKPLTVDIGAAPAPVIILDAAYDWGTQIKWTITYGTGAFNPGGATSGTVYYVAQPAGSAPPTGFVGGDVPAFTMASGVPALQTGTVTVSNGTSGPVFSPFSPNGSLDVYAVIITSSGVISSISPATTVTME